MTTTPFAGLEMKQADRNRHNRPNALVLAAEARAGATVPQIAAKYGCAPQRIYTALREAGYTSTGENAAHQKQGPRPTPSFVYAPEPEEWRDQAACAGRVQHHTDDHWYPETRGGAERQEAEAKAVCGGCPVREVCLEVALRLDAISDGKPHGIWGGLNGEERARLRKGNA